MPFRLRNPVQAVVPWSNGRLLHGREEDLFPHPGLEQWWHHAEAIWNQHRSSDRLSFRARLDFQRGLSKQLPAAAIRVVYNKSGKFLASTIVRDSEAVVAQQLYWAAIASLDEARFLTAFLNSSVVTQAVRPFQSRGENSHRDFAKLPFRLPIPLYDKSSPEHTELSSLAEHAEQVVGLTSFPDRDFKDLRASARDLLISDGVAADIDNLVKRILYRD